MLEPPCNTAKRSLWKRRIFTGLLCVFFHGMASLTLLQVLWAYGDPPSVTRFQDPDGTSFQLELIPVEYMPSPELMSATQSGILFLYRFLKQELKAAFPSELVFKVRIFANPNQYAEYTRSQSRGTAFSSIGVYFPHLREMAVSLQSEDAETLETIFHETVHAFLGQALPAIPRWLNEGLAQYFETLRPEANGGLTVSPVPGLDYYAQRLLAAGELMELRAYLEVGGDWKEYNDATLSPPYAVAWSLTYFLMGSPEGKEVLQKLITHFKSAPEGAIPSTTETINLYYPGGLEALESAWRTDIPKTRTPHSYSLGS